MILQRFFCIKSIGADLKVITNNQITLINIKPNSTATISVHSSAVSSRFLGVWSLEYGVAIHRIGMLTFHYHVERHEVQFSLQKTSLGTMVLASQELR